MKVAIVQTNIEWENPEANLNHIAAQLQSLGACDVIVLPEMFTTGFTMNPKAIAETHDVSDMYTLHWMHQLAKRHDAAVTGSVAVYAKGIYHNRLYWVEPSGQFLHYDKRHLFTFAGEDQHYTAGEYIVTSEWRGVKFMLQICYDLRFPEAVRNGIADGQTRYDVLIYVANWPEARRTAWSTLLKARAIENQCFVLGANRVGTDGNGIQYTGDSVVLDAKGDLLAEAPEGRPAVLVADLDFDALASFRAKFPVLHDRKG